MDLEKILSDLSFKDLSDSEKEELVRKLVDESMSEENDSLEAVIFNPKTNEKITIAEIVKKIGMEDTVKMIVQALNDSVIPISFSKEKYEEAIEALNKGIATDEQKEIVRFAKNFLEAPELAKFQLFLTEAMLSSVEYKQNSHGLLNPLISDFINAINIISIENSLLVEDELKIYDELDIGSILSMVSDIAHDIVDTWKKSCSTPLNDALVVNALLFAANEIAFNKHMTFAPAKEIADRLGIGLNSENESKNGSNNFSESETEDMKNLFKE